MRLESELRHGVIAFGGGALMAAVAPVLIPEGQRYRSARTVLAAFGAGGIPFFLVDRSRSTPPKTSTADGGKAVWSYNDRSVAESIVFRTRVILES